MTDPRICAWSADKRLRSLIETPEIETAIIAHFNPAGDCRITAPLGSVYRIIIWIKTRAETHDASICLVVMSGSSFAGTNGITIVSPSSGVLGASMLIPSFTPIDRNTIPQATQEILIRMTRIFESRNCSALDDVTKLECLQ